jgi:hypothetical protein
MFQSCHIMADLVFWLVRFVAPVSACAMFPCGMPEHHGAKTRKSVDVHFLFLTFMGSWF